MSEPAAQTDIWDEKPKTDSTHLCACLSLSLSHTPRWLTIWIERFLFISTWTLALPNEGKRSLESLLRERRKKIVYAANYAHILICMKFILEPAHSKKKTQDNTTLWLCIVRLNIFRSIFIFVVLVNLMRWGLHFFSYDLFSALFNIFRYSTRKVDNNIYLCLFFRSIFHMKPLLGINHFLII